MATAGNYGAFVPTNFIWDVSQLYSVEVDSPQFKELLVRLYQNLNIMALVLNVKDSGYYVQEEFVNGQLWFPNPANNSSTEANATFRPVQRKTINFGPLLDASSKSIPHGITCNSSTTFTRIYAVASDTTGKTYLPIPYTSATAADIIEIFVDSTNVVIVTNSNRTNFDTCYVILEYLQS